MPLLGSLVRGEHDLSLGTRELAVAMSLDVTVHEVEGAATVAALF